MLTQETIRILNELIRICRDAEELGRLSGDAAASAALASALRQRGESWGRQGDELQALVLAMDGQPETHGTPAAWLSRARVLARSRLLGRGDAPVREEWERLQRRAALHYEEALSTYLPERVRRTVSLQARRLEAACGPRITTRGRYALHTHGA